MTRRKFHYTTVTAVIIANMIGTGVFTSLGFQLVGIQSGFVLLMLWVVGGLAALCGAMTYAELGAALPRSGGEYNFLSRIYHPGAGFVSGWVSATIGFSGPSALAAMTFAAYAMAAFPEIDSYWLRKALAVSLVIILTVVHAGSRRNSGGLQVSFTILKVAVIVIFCAAAIALGGSQPIDFLPAAGDGALLTSGAFAVSLIFVSYAYTGWNAATYLSSELDNPQRTLPWVLIVGTSVVTLLYVALNYVFLAVTPIDAMTGQLEVGAIAAQSAFGELGGRFFGMVLALLLISTVSAMTIAGPRVLQVIGEDFRGLKFLGETNEDGIPSRAIYIQSALTLAFILIPTFEEMLVFAGFTLALNSFATVAGVFVLRLRQPDLPRPYRTFGYPITPLLYLVLTGWTLYFVLVDRPVQGLFGIGIVASGLIIYALSAHINKAQSSSTSS